MALDTKYRPRTFSDVVGQEQTLAVLKEFVRSGAGFHQSYLFCGAFGSGKTTMARILARALLCDAPVNGEPCDQCPSCLSILSSGVSDSFTEFDAATNSGKDAIKSLTDTLLYDSFSGKRRIFLIDEAHRLSKDALDALLKPMEDTLPGSEDKIMVCIFCTTEPEKMRNTIFSRCAPAFMIRQVTPERLADRLEYVCKAESIPYDRQALVLIGEVTECHIRDALKAIEGISMLGAVDVANTSSYLRLNANTHYMTLLEKLHSDLSGCLAVLDQLAEVVSPSTAYEKLAELAMLTFSTPQTKKKVPVYWDAERIQTLANQYGPFLLEIASTLASRPQRSSYATLSCDLAMLHYKLHNIPAIPPSGNSKSPEIQQKTNLESKPDGTVKQAVPEKPFITQSGVFIDPRAVNRRDTNEAPKLSVSDFKSRLAGLVNAKSSGSS